MKAFKTRLYSSRVFASRGSRRKSSAMSGSLTSSQYAGGSKADAPPLPPRAFWSSASWSAEGTSVFSISNQPWSLDQPTGGWSVDAPAALCMRDPKAQPSSRSRAICTMLPTWSTMQGSSASMSDGRSAPCSTSRDAGRATGTTGGASRNILRLKPVLTFIWSMRSMLASYAAVSWILPWRAT